MYILLNSTSSFLKILQPNILERYIEIKTSQNNDLLITLLEISQQKMPKKIHKVFYIINKKNAKLKVCVFY